MKKRDIPRIGAEYPAGRIEAILQPTGKSRCTRVRVRCSHCSEHKLFICRYSVLKDGSRKSCGCLKVEAFKKMQTSRVNALEPALRNALFEAHEHLGDAKIAARQCGVDSYLASFAWQGERQRLSSLPDEELKGIYELAQVRSIDQVALKYDYTEVQILAMCRIWRRRMEDGRKAFDVIVARLMKHAPAGSFTGDVFRDARLYIGFALDSAEGMEGDSWGSGWRTGELTPKELRRTTRSEFGWVFETLRAMESEFILPCFGTAGQRFLAVCENTLKNRKRRRKDKFLEILEKGAKPKVKSAGLKRKRGPNQDYLPKPTLPPSEIADLFSEFGRIQATEGQTFEAALPA